MSINERTGVIIAIVFGLATMVGIIAKTVPSTGKQQCTLWEVRFGDRYEIRTDLIQFKQGLVVFDDPSGDKFVVPLNQVQYMKYDSSCETEEVINKNVSKKEKI